MTVIALTIFGFAIAGLMLYWFNRHLKSASLLMKENRNVAPLFKEKSAGLKYQALVDELKNNAEALKQLQELQASYKAGQIDIDVYHDALDEMEQHYQPH